MRRGKKRDCHDGFDDVFVLGIILTQDVCLIMGQ